MNSIIITGANSGIGFECALHMAKIAPNEQIILACRNLSLANEALLKIKSKTGHAHLKCLPLDLASLQSVREFTNTFGEENSGISALINNAGVQNIREVKFTPDGIEETFATNHLGPFYLTLLLLPKLVKDSSITFTSSDTHDPLNKTSVEPPIYTTARELAYPTPASEKLSVAGQRRYSTSKLCNILTTYELQRRLEGTQIRVNAFNPGVVPGTGIARTYPAFIQFIWKNFMPTLTYFKKDTNTAEKSGTTLANIAYAGEFKKYAGLYFNGGKPVQSSSDSYNETFQKDLWQTSVQLTGITQQETSVRLN